VGRGLKGKEKGRKRKPRLDFRCNLSNQLEMKEGSDENMNGLVSRGFLILHTKSGPHFGIKPLARAGGQKKNRKRGNHMRRLGRLF